MNQLVQPTPHGATPAAQDRGRVLIFDTTLRDGEQAPGFSMGPDEKVEVARVLTQLGVDVIEAGFAAASPGDEDSLRRVAGEVDGPIICSLARAYESDIAAAARSLEPGTRRRIHIFLATSPIHRTAKLKMSKEEVKEAAIRSVAFARTLVDDVEFSAEDAIRTEPEFLAEVLQAVFDAGAQTLNVPDTVGYSTPGEIGRLFTDLRAAVDRPDAVYSCHCHDDLGMAVANSLAAVEAGARQIEGAINGIGERAGNCALEEIVMALRTRCDIYGLTTTIDTQRLLEVSHLVSRVTGQAVPRNKAIVGLNAFAHEAGIHQHGVMADASTYEIMRPQDVGFAGTHLVLGKHSGRHALAERAQALGFILRGNQLAVAFAAFKARADRIGLIDDAELTAILSAFASPLLASPAPEFAYAPVT
jgi:2-isopropylmalate synthase